MAEALRFMETEIDRPATSRVAGLDDGFELRTFSHTFGDGGLTNVYDLSWGPGDARAAVRLSARPTTGDEVAQGALAITTAAFFVLVDETSGLPRQTSLNLAIEQGRILSLPVTDREAVLCQDGVLSMDHITADGLLTINGVGLTWAGSRTGRTAESYIYGNGNIVVARKVDSATGTTVRALDEESRFTPAMPAGVGWVDVGFSALGDGGFNSAAIAPEGGLDIFAHDIVVRCQEKHISQHGTNRMTIVRVGSLQAESLPDSAVTVGPSLDVPDFSAHPINRDPSLGDIPPFADQRHARLVLYADPLARTHIRLFDGRPASPTFRGVTPSEARDAIAADTGYQWGCFLDGGQTAKMWVVEDDAMTSYGNRHYLRWPERDADPFVWAPDRGRPISSFIAFQRERSAARSLASSYAVTRRPRGKAPSRPVLPPPAPSPSRDQGPSL
jgi:hypothetical protein